MSHPKIEQEEGGCHEPMTALRQLRKEIFVVVFMAGLGSSAVDWQNKIFMASHGKNFPVPQRVVPRFGGMRDFQLCSIFK